MPYVAFEGFECSGKSTFANIFRRGIQALDYGVVDLHQPGHTAMGKALRPLIKSKDIAVRDPETLDYLFWADNLEMGALLTQLAEKNPDAWLVADRITMVSNITYGKARKTPIADAQWHWRHAATKYPRLVPDLTFFFQTDKETFERRMKTRGEAADRFEEATEQHTTILEAYEDFFKPIMQFPMKAYRIDSRQPIQAIVRRIGAAMFEHFKFGWEPVEGDPDLSYLLMLEEEGKI